MKLAIPNISVSILHVYKLLNVKHKFADILGVGLLTKPCLCQVLIQAVHNQWHSQLSCFETVAILSFRLPLNSVIPRRFDMVM